MMFDKYGVEIKYSYMELSFFHILKECKQIGIAETLAKNPNTFKLHNEDENPYYVITTNKKTAVVQEDPDGNYRMVDVSLTLYYAIYKKDMSKLIEILDAERLLL
jgi:hypothetical protein